MDSKSDDLFLKEIYDYCMSVEWRSDKLEEKAKELNIDYAKLRQLARKYAYTTLDYVEYHKIDELIKKMTFNDIRDKREYRKLTLVKPNPILYKLFGKTTFQLWENEEEKVLVLKYMFDFCCNCDFDDRLVEFKEWLGINSVEKVCEYAKQYAMEYLKYTYENWLDLKNKYKYKKQQVSYKNRENESKKVYEKLLNVDSLNDIINIIDSSGCNINTLLSGIGDYVAVHKNSNKELIGNLKSKLKMYTDYKSQQMKELKQKEEKALKAIENSTKIPIAIEKVRQFINDGSCDKIEDFCKKNNIERNVFSDYVVLVKEVDENLFNLYTNKVENSQKRRYAKIVANINLIIKYLKTGIEEYGVIRPFDVVDYFMVTNLSFQDILKLSKSVLSQSDYALLRKFISQNTIGFSNNPSLINQILSEKVVVKYEKDKKGLPIPGSEVIFSNEDKLMLIDYLKRNNVPINLKTYGIVFRRYRNGLLNLETEEIDKFSNKHK